MGRKSARCNAPARMPFLRYPALHMVSLLRQTQSAAPVSTHLPCAMVATPFAHHHGIRMHVERRTEHPGLVRLRSDEHHPPSVGRQMPRQPDDLVHRCWNQHRHRLHRLVAANSAHPVATTTAPTKVVAVCRFWLGALVRSHF